MNGRVLHPLTKQALDNFLNQPSHALLLVGPVGSGKATLAVNLAEKILELDGSFDDYPYKMRLTKEGISIGIEPVRQLERFLSLKVPRSSPINRAVIIEDAQSLTLEAQNALLKTLEEPPAATIIVLTASHAQSLLPTVRSRLQTIDVKRPDITNLNQHFKNLNYDDKQITQAYAISDGLPGLMTALLEQSDHPLLQATEQARTWLRTSAYERLLLVDDLAKQRELAHDTALILQQMAHVSLQTAAGRAAKRWQSVLEASFATIKAFNDSAQPKLALTNLALAF